MSWSDRNVGNRKMVWSRAGKQMLLSMWDGGGPSGHVGAPVCSYTPWGTGICKPLHRIKVPGPSFVGDM